ncbi:MAG TPA: type II secretion system protein, partial [Bacilli bacterium]|nr:type II secretion system protein [Bacilli bacterium]
MNNKGFTLVEVLGVIVVLTLIFALAFPNVMRQFKKSDDAITLATKKIIIEGFKDYVEDNDIDIEGGYCIGISNLLEQDYVTDNELNDFDY